LNFQMTSLFVARLSSLFYSPVGVLPPAFNFLCVCVCV
jgi:hypothetical protein